MDKLKAMHTFVQIVESGSLTGAASRLQTSLTSVVRQLATLEEELGLRLLRRTTRRMALTDEGRDYYERCRRWLQEMGEFESMLTDRAHMPSGRIRLTAPVMFGSLHVCPVVTEFLQTFPQTRAEVLLLDRVVDLLEEDIDLAVRIGNLPDSSLVGLPLGSTRQVICASPAFVQQHGLPQHPKGLNQQAAVRRIGATEGTEWSFARPGEKLKVSLKESFVSNHVEAVLQACCAGMGYGRFLGYQTAKLEAQGQLVRVLREWEPEASPVHLVYPYSRLLSARLRKFVDWAASKLRERLMHV
jgi:DNA-binding transcriptional LysR family regulator